MLEEYIIMFYMYTLNQRHFEKYVLLVEMENKILHD